MKQLLKNTFLDRDFKLFDAILDIVIVFKMFLKNFNFSLL